MVWIICHCCVFVRGGAIVFTIIKVISSCSFYPTTRNFEHAAHPLSALLLLLVLISRAWREAVAMVEAVVVGSSAVLPSKKKPAGRGVKR